MYKLTLAPDETMYSTQDGSGAISVKLDGGASKMRRGYANAPTTVTVQWSCDANEFKYLRTFFNLHDFGATPFLMDLILNRPELTEHECRFVPDTFKLTKIETQLYVVRATLEVIPEVPDVAFDAGFVVSFEAFGSASSEAYAILAELVNVNLPASLQ